MTQPQEKAFRLEVELAFHDLCQPLTTLQFALELGRQSGDVEVLRQTVEQGLHETARIFDAIVAMRKMLAGTQTSEWTDNSFKDTGPWTEDSAK